MEQYHEEKDGTRNTILLGIFNEEKHLTWLEDNPSKRPKPGAGRKHVSNMYTDGSYCLLTGIQIFIANLHISRYFSRFSDVFPLYSFHQIIFYQIFLSLYRFL